MKNIGEKHHSKRKKSGIKANLIILAWGVVFIVVHELMRGHVYFEVFSVISTILLLGITFFVTWRWYQSLDEFEKPLLDKSGLLAMYSGMGIALPWLVLNKYGFVQYKLDAVVLILIMFSISACYYYGKKFLD